MRSHYHESLNGENNIDCSEETKTEAQKDQHRLSDDEQDVKDGEISFQNFLVLSQCKGADKPDVFRFSDGTVSWQEKLTLKAQPVFDTLTIIETSLDMSCCVNDLTRKSITAQAKMFGDLIRDLGD